jgi:hypothetical protein
VSAADSISSEGLTPSSAHLVLGNLYIKLAKYNDALSSFTDARETLSAPDRAPSQPATAMMIYKQGLAVFEAQDYHKAALVSTSINERAEKLTMAIFAV